MSYRFSFVLLAALAGTFSPANADIRIRSALDVNTPIVSASPTLAPFQHIRFCLRYPEECKSNSTNSERIVLNIETMDLLKRVNHDVNQSIVAKTKSYGSNLDDIWTLSPDTGDCNDYAVTKRHELLENGLPSSALRLAVVMTPSGIGHLVLVVATTQGDIVLDNLARNILPWQITSYRWVRIQSDTDPRFWNAISPPEAGRNVSQMTSKFRVANR
jgi:predicted transglutaminase-like cysteine proteinase